MPFVFFEMAQLVYLRLSGQGRIQDFFRRGCSHLLLYFNTNKPHSFFLQNTSCIRKQQVISEGGGEGGGVHPLHPPPKSAPAVVELIKTLLKHAKSSKFFCIKSSLQFMHNQEPMLLA